MLEGISYTDTKKLTAIIKERFNLDFSNYAMSSFRHRVSVAISKFNLVSADSLIEKLLNDSYMFDLFLKEVSIYTTEMFRDPSAWKYISETVLPKLASQNEKINIWLPECTSGEDIYTIAIILKELGLTQKSNITASFISNSLMTSFSQGYEIKKMELNKSNYLRFNEKNDFSEYYSISNYKAFMNSDLLKNVSIEKFLIAPMINPTMVNLIIYRNKLIFFNSILQFDVLTMLTNSLECGGFLFIGAKENIINPEMRKHYKVISEHERIYKRISKN
ncbi:MAG: hypothetical protein A2046_16350 [Bacteroidetes bacterium GWA2_30_7]|nr:MAG: hypothetical protein A2046_16350 [Bacteroidetes bacterium GWA2_30_7]